MGDRARVLSWHDFRRICAGRRLPLAIVDLDAFEANAHSLLARLSASERTLRIATKSLRHVGLIERAMALGGERARGLLCYSLEEACRLADQGFDDLLVAYPSSQKNALREVAQHVSAGKTIRPMVDAEVHLRAIDEVGRAEGVLFECVVDVDVAYHVLNRGPKLGVLRSPLRAAQVEGFLRRADAYSALRIVGAMGYEAHIAGLPDDNPFRASMNLPHRLFKRAAIPQVRQERLDVVRAFEAAGVELALFNGGGTASIDSSAIDSSLTEVTAGSGFLGPHLFDYYAGLELRPALFFALEVCRKPRPDVVTCQGGGYVASGPPNADRLPIPLSPPGLEFITDEGAGEVQTPLRVPGDAPELQIGDPVIFRPTKAGELAERFNVYAMLKDGELRDEEKTYRGMGWSFF